MPAMIVSVRHRLLAAAIAAARPAFAADPIVVTGSEKVIHGDTIEIGAQRIRIHGIDAPEAAQTCELAKRKIPCRRQSTEVLSRKIGRGKVTCTGNDRDRYQRLIAACLSGNTDLGAWMVEQGRAVAFVKYSGDYVSVEQRARGRKVGIWAISFQMPWDYRVRIAAADNASAAAPSGNCLIKGNITVKGERIYNLPGGAMYDKTDVKANRGEHWFCTAAEARAAGWRATRR